MSDMPTNTPNIEDPLGLRNMYAERSNVALPDPTPAPMDVHREKLEAVINTACAMALENERVNIERIHGLMRAVQQKRDAIAEQIDEYLLLIQAVTDQGAIIHDALEAMEHRVFNPVVIEPKPNGKQS